MSEDEDAPKRDVSTIDVSNTPDNNTKVIKELSKKRDTSPGEDGHTTKSGSGAQGYDEEIVTSQVNVYTNQEKISVIKAAINNNNTALAQGVIDKMDAISPEHTMTSMNKGAPTQELLDAIVLSAEKNPRDFQTRMAATIAVLSDGQKSDQDCKKIASDIHKTIEDKQPGWGATLANAIHSLMPKALGGKSFDELQKESHKTFVDALKTTLQTHSGTPGESTIRVSGGQTQVMGK